MTLLFSLIALAAYFAMPEPLRVSLIRPVRAAFAGALRHLPDIGQWPQLILLVALPVVIVWLAYDLLWSAHLVPLAFLLVLAVLVVVFGDTRHDPVVPSLSDEQRAQLADPATLQVASAYARRNALCAQLNELFTPLFWLFVLGPVGSLACYLLRYYATLGGEETLCEALEGEGEAAPPSVSAAAAQMAELAAWLPARMLSLSFALAGNFTSTWQSIQARLLTLANNGELAQLAAEAAEPLRLDATLTPEVALSDSVFQLQSLLHRALAVWMVFLALHTLWP